MANRLCPLCGASYVDWAASCSDCGVALIDPDSTEDPRTLAEDEQLVYELASWSLDQRTEVAQVMAESGIPHAWDDDELYVHLRFESAVDRLLEPIEYPEGVPAGQLDALSLPEGPLTEYDLSEWTPAAREMVTAQLTASGVASSWDGNLLLVSVDDEEAADEVLDELEDSGALDEADDAEESLGDETPGAVLEMLFLASDRLRKDPLDADGLRDLSGALAASNSTHPPYGVEPIMWHRMMALADRLAAAETGESVDATDDELVDDATVTTIAEVDALGEPPQLDEGTAQQVASELRELLRPFV